ARRRDGTTVDRRLRCGARAARRVQPERIARLGAREETRIVSGDPATAIVIGASSGLGRALAEELARQRYSLLLVASARRDLDALGASLDVAHGTATRSLALDLGREADPGARIAAALDGLPPAKVLLLP